MKLNSVADVLIFKSPRKTVYNGKEIDICTYFLEKELIADPDFNVQSLDLLPNGRDDITDQKSYIASNLKLLSYLQEKLTKIKIQEKDRDLFKNINNEIKGKYKIKFNFFPVATRYIKRFKINYKYYNRLFKRLKPKKIILVCSYGLEHIISAAQENNIEVFEIQHGTMSDKHVGYHFPNNNKVPYFPNQYMIFGEFWREISSLPLTKENIIVFGYPYLKKQIKKYSLIKKNKKKVVFISQGTIGKDLSKIAYEFAFNNTDYVVDFKLHPKEYAVWKGEYEYLQKADKLSNFNVIDNNLKSLHEIIAESEFQVGVYSTVIYEGLALGLKTILINLPGIENMKFLIDKEIVEVAIGEEDLKAKMLICNTQRQYQQYFFADTNYSQIKSLLKDD